MQALSTIDCPAEPHFLQVLVKVKNIFGKMSQPRLCGNSYFSLVKANMAYGHEVKVRIYSTAVV